MFVKACCMTDEEKRIVSEITGKIMLGLLDDRSTNDIAKITKLYPNEVEWNIDETLYVLKRRVGLWRYLKILFIK